MVGILLQALRDDPTELAWQSVARPVNRRRLVFQDRRGERCGVVSRKGASTGRHLVEDDPQREDVRTVIDRVPLNLFRRHVGKRAHHAALAGQGLGLHEGSARLTHFRAELGQPEVEHLDPAVFSDHHVRRLEIPMDDAPLMGRGQGLRHRHREIEKAVDLEPLIGDQLVEPPSLDQLHDEKMNGAAVSDTLFAGGALGLCLSHLVNGHDVGMAEGGDGAGLTLEAFEPIRVGCHLLGQHLERHLAPQLGVLGEIDLPHAARTELVQDLVVGELAADHRIAAILPVTE